MNILIEIDSQQKGLFMSIGQHFLNQKNEVAFIARDEKVEKLIKNNIKGQNYKIFLLPDFQSKPKIQNNEKVMEESCKLEKKYGINFSFLMSKDRAFGRGYLFNAIKYPKVLRSKWTKIYKYKTINDKFNFFNYIFDDFKPNLILSHSRTYELNIIANYHSVKYLTLTTLRFGSRLFWSDNEFLTSSRLINSIKTNILKDVDTLKDIKYEQLEESRLAHKDIDYSFFGAIKGSYEQILKEVKQILLNNRKKNSYTLFGWIPTRFRRYLIYKFLTSKGVVPGDKKIGKYIYFPLHLEPEIALLGASPEFNNSMELATWLAKSLPVDFNLVIKEQPFSFGIRPKWFYEQLLEIPGVYFAKPQVHPWDWIKGSSIVSTISGTAGVEGVYFKKPVMSFGKHQFINYLPTVKHCTSFFDTKENFEKLISLEQKSEIFELSKKSLMSAMSENSFDLPEYKYKYKSEKFENEMAKIVITELEKYLDFN